jgi:hypothetical protein
MGALNTSILDAHEGWECPHGTRNGRTGLNRERRWAALFCPQNVCSPVFLEDLAAYQLTKVMANYAGAKARTFARADAVAARRHEREQAAA